MYFFYEVREMKSVKGFGFAGISTKTVEGGGWRVE
jgi:hypothetical protein